MADLTLNVIIISTFRVNKNNYYKNIVITGLIMFA